MDYLHATLQGDQLNAGCLCISKDVNNFRHSTPQQLHFQAFPN